MAPLFRRVLLVGATSGIGKAMADRLVKEGSKVIAVGRRQDRLDEFVGAHGKDNASGVAFDISETDKIPQFAEDIIKIYPDLDCVFLNAGIQRRYDFSHPETVNLAQFNAETNVNYTSFVALTHAFLPFLLKKQSSLVFTGSNLAIIPAFPLPSYSASKAALNAFVLCLREQLSNTSIKVFEISPPPVQTELHDAEMGEEAGRKLGMPLDQFTDRAYEGLVAGKDQVIVGSIGPADTFNEVIDKRRTACENLAKVMRAGSVPSTK